MGLLPLAIARLQSAGSQVSASFQSPQRHRSHRIQSTSRVLLVGILQLNISPWQSPGHLLTKVSHLPVSMLTAERATLLVRQRDDGDLLDETRPMTKLEMVLAASTVFLLVIAGTFIGLFAGTEVALNKERQHHKHGHHHDPSYPAPPSVSYIRLTPLTSGCMHVL